MNLRKFTFQLRPFRNKLADLKTWANWKKRGSFNTWPEHSLRKDSSALQPDKLIRAQMILWSACFLCPILTDLFDHTYQVAVQEDQETKSPTCLLSSEDESYAIRTDSISSLDVSWVDYLMGNGSPKKSAMDTNYSIVSFLFDGSPEQTVSCSRIRIYT